MKGRQLGFVLMAMIAVGIAGLIIRVVSSGEEDLVLSGLVPLPQDVVTKVTISSGDSEATLIRREDEWTIDGQPVFLPKQNQFWTAVSDIDGAQLISTNPDNYERIGVAEGQGTVVSFYLGPSIQEQFIVGKWTPDVRLCFIRRARKTEVYGVPCLRPDVFDTNPDGWRNPLIVALPTNEIESVTFTYPDEEFILKISEEALLVESDGESQPANAFQVVTVLSTLEALVSSGFATDEEAKGLRFSAPDAALRVITREGALNPDTRLRFLKRDDESYYLSTPTLPTVFIVDNVVADSLLKTKAQLTSTQGE